MDSPSKNNPIIKTENLDSNPNYSSPVSLIPATDIAAGASDGGGVDGSGGSLPVVCGGSKRRQEESADVDQSKRVKVTEELNSGVAPPGLLAPIPVNVVAPPHVAGEEKVESPMPLSVYYGNQEKIGKAVVVPAAPPVFRGRRNFWRAGDYDEVPASASDTIRSSVGMDHVRVHPRFLHSNATSHKWALGAFAELLDNALDEVRDGATYVKVDVMRNQRDNNPMLLIEDNGGGMDLDKMRNCMSLGYSAKSKMANTIGQYGNGFKTSSMRLGADVIVFSRCNGDNGTSATLSVGLLSYTFLTATGQEDIVVPMVNFEEKGDGEWAKAGRATQDWDNTFEIILEWSPFANSQELLHQFDSLENQGTRIIIYNLWEDDDGHLELDFDAHPHDIQIRGVNRDEKMIKMADQFPSARHFFTYKHSLRSYASILYLNLPSEFKIFLRGEEIEHHNIVDDLKLVQDINYKPMNNVEDNMNNHRNMVATGKIGFIKDADHHIEVQGFNVYHKNRLIKPFWRVWNAAGSDGRGVIGILEANFIEPAHDKQGFERTTSLSRLENRLNQIQKNFWNSRCHEIGYADRRGSKKRNSSGPGCSINNVESNTNGPRASPANGMSTSQQCSAPETQRVPLVKPVVLTPQGHFGQHNESTDFGNMRPEPVLNSSGGSRNLQMPPHLRPLNGIIRMDGQNTTTSNVDVEILQNTIKRKCEIIVQLESQLEEQTKKLETMEMKVENSEKEKVAILDMLESERNTWAIKEKDLIRKLKILEENKLKESKLEAID